MNFNQLFVISNGMISPRVPVHIGGVTMTPGVAFGNGVIMGGVHLADHVGKDFEVEVQNQVYVIKGVYK